MSKLSGLSLRTSLLALFGVFSESLLGETIDCIEIPSIPYVISEQGVYCLKQNLAGSLLYGDGIVVATNNVTIDMNGYKLGNLAAGAATNASGISASGRSNLILRNGVIRGFLRGVEFAGSGGAHLVENVRLDGNTHVGIFVSAPNVTLLDNTIVDTGGSSVASLTHAYGIVVFGESVTISGNQISGVVSSGTSPARGIHVVSDEAQILNNSISGLVAPAASFESYLFYAGQGGIIEGNRMMASAADQTNGITVNGGSMALCRNNQAVGFNAATFQCSDGGGNVSVKTPY